MSPLERVCARASAFETLGVDHASGPEDLRAAWRRVAFDMHPDRCGGDQSGFVRAKAAYDFLCQDEAAAYSAPAVSREAAESVRMSRADAPREETGAARAARRTRVRARVEALTPEMRAVCEDRVAWGAQPNLGAFLRLQPDAPLPSGAARVTHVPVAIERSGRRLTYLMSAGMAPGVNLVALPTAILEGGRHPRSEVIAVSTKDALRGDVIVPDTTRATLFPGAREVRLRFGTGPVLVADTRA